MLADRSARPSASAVLVHDVTAIDAHVTMRDAWLLTQGDSIVARGTGEDWRALAGPDRAASLEDLVVVDGSGGYLTPGFIDVHCHGGGGFSAEGGADAIRGVLAAHHAHGTTRSLLSLVAGPVEALADHLAVVAELVAEDPLLLGSHLEGPFLSVARRGAHGEQHLVDPDADVVARLLEAADGTLRLVTIDPERPGAGAAIATLTAAGVTVAVGHTEADYATSLEAFAAGASALTHAFNAMPGIHHRAPGPIVAAIDSDDVVLELILDGEHVHPRVAALLFAEAPSRIALVTDAMAAAAIDGDAPSRYRLGDLDVDVVDGRAVLAGTQTLAGSTLTLDRALRVGLDAGIPVQALVEALTLTPARMLGVDGRFGSLDQGRAADLVLFDADWTVRRVFADGREL